MIDNKLNRIKGILSARQGAEIPKYQSPGSPLPKPFYIQNGKFFLDGKEVTQDEWFKDKRVRDSQKKFISGMRNRMSTSLNTPTSEMQSEVVETEIPGQIPITPTTAIENSAEQIKKSEEVKQDTLAQIDGSYMLPIVEVLGKNKRVQQESAEVKESDGENLDKQNKQNQVLGKASEIGTEIFKGVGQVIGAKQAITDSNLTKGADALYDTTSGVVKNLGPVGKIIGTAMENAAIAGDIIQGLGGGTDQMTTTDKWMDSSFFSWNIGMINGFGGKKTDSFAADQDILANIGSSYGGTTEDINNAASKAGKKYGSFSSSSRRKANRQIANARTKQNLMGDISEEATDQRLNVQSMGEQAGLAYSLMTDGGYNQKYTYAAKEGGIIEWNPVIELEWKPKIELNWELSEYKKGGELPEGLEWVPEFKSGGKTEDIPETTQKNVIPEGALHKNKHHMEHAEGLTKKGIPVIDEDGEQQAEIEHSEIIFTLEVTKKLEEYYDIFYSEESSNKEKEQAALDAGKLLVYQILENTEDRTGLIESCKKGGTIQLKKSTDDLIEEVLEWMPTIVVIEEKEIKEKDKSEKEQMKEAIKEVLIELLTK